MNINKKSVNVSLALIHLANQKGYITYEDILNHIDSANIFLDELDMICDFIISKGVIITYNNEISKSDDYIKQQKYSKSRIDYNSIYRKILKIDGSLVNYIEKLKLISPPYKGEDSLLIFYAKEGNSYARERIITMFLKTSLRIALRHYERFGHPLDESIQNASIGLLLAIDKISLNEQFQYSTYANWWIRQCINRETQGFSKVFYNFPSHIKEKISLILSIDKAYFCSKCNRYERCTHRIEHIAKKLSIDKERVDYYFNLLSTPVSLNQLKENNDLLNNNIYFWDDIIENLQRKDLKNQVFKMLSILKEKERKVLELRYGLNNDESKTLDEVGKVFGLTRERIRQIEVKAFNKLKEIYTYNEIM